MKHQPAISGFFRALRDLLFPARCASCKERLELRSATSDCICAPCWARIKRNLPPFCSRCGIHLEKHWMTAKVCPSCTRAQLHFDRAMSPCLYEGTLKNLIHSFKYGRKDYLGKPLSSMMISFVKEYSFPMEYIDAIIPIPLHPARQREREFNQAERLADPVAREFTKPLLAAALARIRPTQTQTSLKPSQRFSNVNGCFTLTDAAAVKDKNILLVDDVFTTGATLSEAARTLKRAGSGLVFALTLAH